MGDDAATRGVGLITAHARWVGSIVTVRLGTIRNQSMLLRI